MQPDRGGDSESGSSEGSGLARFEASIRAMQFSSGKNVMTIDELAMVQPGLARIMPDIGARTWKLYYAAEFGNWPMARFQHREVTGLFELGAFMRPKHAGAIEQYLAESWHPLTGPLTNEDFDAFKHRFSAAVEAANAFHVLKDKPYIRWRLPDMPPPDLDLRPPGDA